MSALRATAPLWLLAAGVVVAGWSGPAAEALRYERSAVTHGEVWRLLTAHLVHLGPAHAALNLAALFIIAMWGVRRLGAAAWTGAVIASAAAVGLGLLYLAPRVDWYVGLSGMLHGLLAYVAVLAIGTDTLALPVLAAITAKVAWEQTFGPLPGSETTAGGPVVVGAHFFGTIGGAAWAVLACCVRRVTARLIPRPRRERDND
ncbi:rhombosortase [Arhodomonas sp. AD133]|uniref:rhombosortase n=1 Tax=Arhodomonas sp. AD133 TaxID=3415009 RepID=UPI003EB75ED5